MTDVRGILEELGISQYFEVFLEQGFDTWDTILDITESDFDALGVKLGHRRRLQRKIANSLGIAPVRALVSPKRDAPAEDDHLDTPLSARSESRNSGTKETQASTSTGKRKYRRHPKADEHAPERPPSAYVIFSNKMREDLKGRQLSFTEIAKLVGENWQNLTPSEKEPFETQAFRAKEKYNNELTEYKKTDNFRKYSDYLAEFKAKQNPSPQGASDASTTDASKRPKLENQNSADSSSSTGSSTNRATDVLTTRPRDHSAGAWGGYGSTSSLSPSSQLSGLPTLAMSSIPPPVLSTSSSQILPGYREAVYGNVNNQQTASWREAVRGIRDPEGSFPPQLPRILNVPHRRPSSGLSSSEPSIGSQAPPPLSTESTNMSSISSVSNNSYVAPRTPLEPSLVDKPPMGFPNKPLFELPPLRPPSLSPSTSMNIPLTSIPSLDYSNSNARRGATLPMPAQLPSSLEATEELHLDPVSALLRAGEIVSRNNPAQYPPR